MHVLATAGHVDHGKSTLVRLLTGTEPDRWEEEHRRGMTLDLGFASTAMDDGCVIAFVDVPGHERFVPTMLAGVGPVPAVLFVVAADEGWKPQSTEHRDALLALGVSHGLLVITRCDLADPAAAIAQARAELDGTALASMPAVPVSGHTGVGLDDVRAALHDLAHQLPGPERDTDIRLWVDRSFTIRGAGTVVTGTLREGTLRVGEQLRVHSTGRSVRVRGLQSLDADCSEVSASARVAVNLRGVARDEVSRGEALLTPRRWLGADVVDVRVDGTDTAQLPTELMLHIGSASTPVRVRPLGKDTARLVLGQALPLRIGDRALLRNPGQRQITGGLSILDVRPPKLTRRGAARERAEVLADRSGLADGAVELRHRQLLRSADLRAMGAAEPSEAVRAGEWLLDPTYRDTLSAQLVSLVEEHHRTHPLAAGLPTDAARRKLNLPDQTVLTAVLHVFPATELTISAGRLRRGTPELPVHLRRGLDAVRTSLRESPFEAPTAGQLAELGMGEQEIAAAVAAGELLRLAPGIVLLPGSDRAAADRLSALPAPFSVSQARRHLGTSRRVAVPLLERLASEGYTERLADGTHHLRP